MTTAAGIALTALLAFGFAATGDAVLRRKSVGAHCWNESFLVGAGVCGSALFPLSLVWPGHAVEATAYIMGLAAIWAVVSRIRHRPSKPRAAQRPEGLGDRLLLGLLGLAVAVFVVLNFRYGFLWDGFLIFATKAKRLFYEGALTRAWFAEDEYNTRLLEYPPLIALSEALLSRLRGSFDFDALKPLFPLFYVSMLMSTFAAFSRAKLRQVALFTALLVALLPELATRMAAGGYSDMPQAAYVAGTVAASFRKESRRTLPWLIGSLTVVKAEGTLLALIAAAAVLVFWSAGGLGKLAQRVMRHATGVAVVAVFLISRIAYLRWLDVHDTTYGPLDGAHLTQAFGRLLFVARLCLQIALELPEWGLLWPGFLIASFLLVTRGSRKERCLSAAVWSAIAAYMTIFLFTNWELSLHVEQAFARLLAQLAPAAAVVIGLAYARTHARWPGRIGEGPSPTGLRRALSSAPGGSA
jgi:hypothetical protein